MSAGYGPSTPSTAEARDVAEWLLEESKAKRLDPIVSVEAAFETVRLDVRPESTAVWETWKNLLRVNDARTTWRGGFVTAHGVWAGVHVVLTGLDVASWGGTRCT